MTLLQTNKLLLVSNKKVNLFYLSFLPSGLPAANNVAPGQQLVDLKDGAKDDTNSGDGMKVNNPEAFKSWKDDGFVTQKQ